MQSKKIYSDKIYSDISETAEDISIALKQQDELKFEKIINNLNASEITDILQTIDFDKLEEFVVKIQDNLDAYMLPALDEERTYQIFKTLGAQKFAKVINNFDDHGFYDFIHHHQNLHEYENLQNYLSEQKKQLLKEFLSYPVGTAARLMQKNFIYVPYKWTVRQIKDYLRSLNDISEDINCILLVNENYNVMGTLSLATLLKISGHLIGENIMNKRFIVVEQYSLQKKVAQLFHRYTLSYALVANEDNSIMGIITLNDITDAMEIQADQDLMHLQYVSTGDGSSIENRSILKSVCSRVPWLFVNVFLAIMVSSFISLFTDLLEKHIQLAVLIPIIASICSISGAQTIATTIHNIAKQEQFNTTNIFKFFAYEICTAIVVAISMTALSSIFVIWRFGPQISLVYCMAMSAAFIIASLSGIVVPLFTHFIKLDPAIISPILVTTISDFSSYLLAFMLAILLLS